jgi:hypothetical protein
MMTWSRIPHSRSQLVYTARVMQIKKGVVVGDLHRDASTISRLHAALCRTVIRDQNRSCSVGSTLRQQLMPDSRRGSGTAEIEASSALLWNQAFDDVST